ncbi:MAG TPA: ribonuclease Z [Gemmatimonadales bacterium]|nr:ribonuclease Z [Gemmatimonadales bacterium]
MTLALVTVGTGTVAPSATRAGPAHWVERGDVRLLMDCGAGATHQLARCGLAWEHVSHVAVSHFHPDHFGELPALLFALRHATKREEPLVIVGPAGTVRLVKALAEGFGDWMLDPGYPIGILDLHAGEPFPLSPDVMLDVHPTPHTPESVAFGVSAPEGRIVYTGDTGPSDDLAVWAKGCDLLLAECSLPDGQGVDGHLTPDGVGRLAADAGAGRLVLTHLYPPAEAVDVRGAVARRYRGPVAVAADGDRFEVQR